MNSDKKYHLGLLYLVHLLINADGVVNDNEKKALVKIKSKEGISDSIFDGFLLDVIRLKPKEIYQKGIELINECEEEKKLKAFVHLYKISEVDGSVHVKEVRLLLYSVKMANIEFNDVVAAASKITAY